MELRVVNSKLTGVVGCGLFSDPKMSSATDDDHRLKQTLESLWREHSTGIIFIVLLFAAVFALFVVLVLLKWIERQRSHPDDRRRRPCKAVNDVECGTASLPYHGGIHICSAGPIDEDRKLPTEGDRVALIDDVAGDEATYKRSLIEKLSIIIGHGDVNRG